MKTMKIMTVLCIFCAMTLGAVAWAAPWQQGQTDAMQGDSMKKDRMDKEAMPQQGMAQEMRKSRVLKGWVSDSECAARGDKKCANKEHLAMGAKLVLVTDADNKIWTVSNPETLAPHQGHHVQVKGTTHDDNHTVSVQEVKMLKQK